MTRPPRALPPSRRTTWTALALLSLAAAPLRAQGTVSIAAAPAAPLVGESGGTVTAVLRVANGTRDSAVVTPTLSPPAAWSVLLGANPFVLAPGDSDTWMLSVRIPARAAAGRYVVPLVADAGTTRLTSDSLVVIVAARRGVEVVLSEQPSFAISGSVWRAGFIVRNTGNVPSSLSLRATSALGSAPALEPTKVELAANETRPVHVRSTTALATQEAHDDVLELFATDVADTTVTATASSRVTVVQRAGRAEARHTVASTLRVRAVERGTGISPFEMTGGGKLRANGDEVVDFTLRGSAGPVSPFGDRDQYSLAIRAPTYVAHLGDALYGTSPLLSSGQMGIGAGIDVTRGSLSYGGYLDRSRYQFAGSTEQSAFVGARPSGMAGAPELRVSAVNRTGGYMAGQLLGISATLHPVGDMLVDVELAASQSANGRGIGQSLHVSGGERVSYDFSHLMGDAGFAGITRGNRHDYAAVATHVTDDLQINASTSSHQTRGNLLNILYGQGLRTASLELAYTSRFALRYQALTRTSDQIGGSSSASQRSIGARVEQGFGDFHLWSSGDFGTSAAALGAPAQRYTALSYGVSAIANGRSFSLYGESHEGSAVTFGADRFSSYGGDATVRLSRTTTLLANALRTRVPTLLGADYGQVDVSLARLLPNGSTATLRTRMMSGVGAALYGSRLVYLEYAMPLRLPTDQLRAPGRVRGQVLNEETGRGVAGALVRLGPQAAVTDENGVVAFAGVPVGTYRLSLAQQATTVETVFSGEPTVQIDSGKHTTAFRVAVQRAGTISGSVRAMRVARTGIGAEPDSLADAGPLGGTMVALAGARDTIYRTADATGEFQFTDVSSGRWTVMIVDQTAGPDQWAPKSVELMVKPGQAVRAAFLRVPRHRGVRILNGDQTAPTIETVPNEDHRQKR